jgi:dephospho-CoA kinase
MGAQLPTPEKEKRADRVIVNDGALEHLHRRVEKAWREATRQHNDAGV